MNRLAIFAALGVCCESAYNWSCSPPSGNVFYFPDIPATVAEIELIQILETTRGEVYIYPTDSHNCSGTVTGVEYCYPSGNNRTGNIFTLLIFDELSSSTTDMDITKIPISTRSACPNSEMICCDSYNFTKELQFSLTSSNFNFGFHIQNSLYGFQNRMSFGVNSYLLSESVLTTGSFTNVFQQPSIRTLRIVRLIVGRYYIIVTVPEKW